MASKRRGAREGLQLHPSSLFQSIFLVFFLLLSSFFSVCLCFVAAVHFGDGSVALALENSSSLKDRSSQPGGRKEGGDSLSSKEHPFLKVGSVFDCRIVGERGPKEDEKGEGLWEILKKAEYSAIRLSQWGKSGNFLTHIYKGVRHLWLSHLGMSRHARTAKWLSFKPRLTRELRALSAEVNKCHTRQAFLIQCWLCFVIINNQAGEGSYQAVRVPMSTPCDSATPPSRLRCPLVSFIFPILV